MIESTTEISLEGTSPRETASTSAHRVPNTLIADYGREKKILVPLNVNSIFLALSCPVTELQFLDILLQIGYCPKLILLHLTLDICPQQAATSGKPSDLIDLYHSLYELKTKISIYSRKYYVS